MVVLVVAVGAAMSWVWAPETGEAPAPVMSSEARQANPPLTQSAPGAERSAEGDVAQRLADLSLEARVTEALADAEAPWLDAVESRAQNGRVVLRGDVEEKAAHDRAAQIARQVEGVEAVVNEVTVNGAPVVTLRDAGESGGEERRAAPSGAAYHVVESGESLWIIAREYGTSVERIRALNGGLRSNRLQPGDRLRVR